jgi:transposase
MILKYSLGLDVSAKDIKACISVIHYDQTVKVKSSCTILNTKSGFVTLKKWIFKWHKEKDIPLSICMEATGIYHENCAYFLNSHDFRVSIILPNKAKRYLQSLGIKSKNDSIDAKGLAQMGAEQNLTQWVPLGTFFYSLRTLTRHHQSIQEQITADQNRLHASTNSAMQNKIEIRQLKSHINFLKNQLENIRKEIKTHIDSNKEFKNKFENVYKIYGISMISAATVIAETNGFELFKNFRQLVSFAGYDVVENQSGKRVGKTKISKCGNSRIRRILHMPSLVAIKEKESKFRQLYIRIFERTGIKMKGIVAVQKKLLVMIYYVWKNDLDYIRTLNYIRPECKETDEKIELKKIATKNMAIQDKHNKNKYNMLSLSVTNV